MIPPSSEQLQKIAKLAKAVSKRYKARCWWADEKDLIQEAWYAMLRAHRTWKAEVGTPYGAYLWSAAVRWLRGVLWKTGSPVSAGWHEMDELANVKRAPLDAARNVAAPRPKTDVVFENAERKHRAVTEIKAVAKAAGAEDYVEAFLSDEKRATKITSRAVRQRFKHHAVQDAGLYQLWMEGE